jgi:hypothetical protein
MIEHEANPTPSKQLEGLKHEEFWREFDFKYYLDFGSKSPQISDSSNCTSLIIIQRVALTASIFANVTRSFIKLCY